jgi:hypothetical protein
MPVVIDVSEFGVKYTKPLSKWRNSNGGALQVIHYGFAFTIESVKHC